MMIPVGKISEIEEGGSKVVQVDGRDVAVYRLDGKFYAMENVCPHRGAPLNEGHVDEKGVLTCPWHAWQFEVKTGACSTVPASRLRTYEVRIEGDEISLDIRN